MIRAKAVLVTGLLLAAVMPFLLSSVYSPNPVPFLKGVSLSPRSFEPSDFSDFFIKARQAGSVVSWAGDWLELDTQNSAPYVVAELASSYGYTPIIQAQFFSQSTGKLLRVLDEATKKIYLDSAVAFASKYRPNYLAFGIEVNILFEKSPADFEEFTAFYAQVYDSVKAVSSSTKVFTIFQLEKMKGLSGGLFGGTNDPSKAEWTLLERFPKNDILSFTSYPSLVFKDPSELPQDYYTVIALHTSKPVAVTETGWHTAPHPIGWEGSDAKQVDFVTKLFGLISGLNMEIVIWSFLYDQNVIQPFDSMGLWRRDGTPKQAWQTWLSAGGSTTTTTTPSTFASSTTGTPASSPRCVIATAAYGSELAGPVHFLRVFRDREVKSTYLGGLFISAFEAWYYSWAPPIAKIETENNMLRTAVRAVISPLLGALFVAHEVFNQLASVNSELAILVAGLVASGIIGITYLLPIVYVIQKLLKRRATRTTLIYIAVFAFLMALWGTLGYGLSDPIQILTVALVIEAIMMPPLLLFSKSRGND